jgi:hypothetical protein
MDGKEFEWRKAQAATIREEVILAEAILVEVIPEVTRAVIPGAHGEDIRAAEVPAGGPGTTGKTLKTIRECSR